MARKSEPDPRLEDVQRRVDDIRRHLHETPGMTVVTHEEIPPVFEEDLEDEIPEGGIDKDVLREHH